MNNVFLFSKRKLHNYKKAKPIKPFLETQSIMNDLLCLHNSNNHNNTKSHESLTVRQYLKKIKERHLSDVPSCIDNDNHPPKKSKVKLFDSKLLIRNAKLNTVCFDATCIPSNIQLPYTTKIILPLFKEHKNFPDKTNRSLFFSNEKILSSIMKAETKYDCYESISLKKMFQSTGSAIKGEMQMSSTEKHSIGANLSLENMNNKDKEVKSSPFFFFKRNQSCQNITANLFNYTKKEKTKITKDKLQKRYDSLTDIRSKIKSDNNLTNTFEFAFKKIYFPEIKRNNKEIIDKKKQIGQVLQKISKQFEVLKEEIS